MILPERVLGSSGTTRMVLGLAMGPISLPTWLRSSAMMASPVVHGVPAQDHERDDGLAGGFVRGADDGGFGHGGVGDEGGFDFGGGEPVPGDVHDVIDPAQEPDVAVLVLLGAVAGEVHGLEAGPVGFLEPFRVAPDAAEHGGPGFADDEEAAVAVGHGFAVLVHDVRRRCRAAGPGRSRVWWR